jgi:hypothetical protein
VLNGSELDKKGCESSTFGERCVSTEVAPKEDEVIC